MEVAHHTECDPDNVEGNLTTKALGSILKQLVQTVSQSSVLDEDAVQSVRLSVQRIGCHPMQTRIFQRLWSFLGQ